MSIREIDKLLTEENRRNNRRKITTTPNTRQRHTYNTFEKKFSIATDKLSRLYYRMSVWTAVTHEGGRHEKGGDL